MSELCEELEGKQFDYAVFVVHAHESILSINEERAGIGYTKIYKTLIQATNNRVLIVIGGDDNYKNTEERDMNVLSHWARRKILSQFTEDYLDGSQSFIFSWDEKHHPIHEEALEFYLSPTEKGPFVPRRPVRSSQPRQEKPEQSKLLEQAKHQPTKVVAPKKHTLPKVLTQPPADQDKKKQISLQVFTCSQSEEAVDTIYRFLTNVYKKVPIDGPPEAPQVDIDMIPSHLSRSKLDFVVIAADKEDVMNAKNEPQVKQYFQEIFQCIEKSIAKKAVVIVCGDDKYKRGDVTSQSVRNALHRLAKDNLNPDKLLVMSWDKEPNDIHMETMVNLLGNSGHPSKGDVTKSDPLSAQTVTPGTERSTEKCTMGTDKSMSGFPSNKEESCTVDQQESQRDRQHGNQVQSQVIQGPLQHDRSYTGKPVHNEQRDRLRYRAVTEKGSTAQISYSDPPGWKPPDTMTEDLKRRHEGEPWVEIEIWEDRNGGLYPVSTVHNERGDRLRYRIVMKKGSITQILYTDPPGWQPPDYMTKEIIRRHGAESMVVVKIWAEMSGGMYPVIEVLNGRGDRLRYRAIMKKGNITEIRYRDPPGWQPPDEMIENLKRNYKNCPEVQLEIWKDNNGDIYPAVVQ